MWHFCSKWDGEVWINEEEVRHESMKKALTGIANNTNLLVTLHFNEMLGKTIIEVVTEK